MLGKTHRRAGAVISLGGYLLFKQFGLLDPNLRDITELITLYAASYYGSIFADIDQPWQSCPCHDPLSRIINKGLHLTSKRLRKMREEKSDRGLKEGRVYKILSVFDARHRSWQTHSELPLLIILYGLIKLPRGFEWTMLMGFFVGYLSHMFMDMLSVDGYNFLTAKILNKLLRHKVLPEKIRLVPKSKFFITDGVFEKLVTRGLNFTSIVLALIIVGSELYYMYQKLI